MVLISVQLLRSALSHSWFGQKTADLVFHDLSGWLMMPAASATDDDIGFNALAEVQPGGHFFGCDHTMPRYATEFHFWVHALRDDLAARSRLDDLEGAAGYALCRPQDFDAWRAEVGALGAFASVGTSVAGDATIYRMQGSECRRSSVASFGGRLRAHFWGHGSGESWRRRGIR